jgi:hypothetical protein
MYDCGVVAVKLNTDLMLDGKEEGAYFVTIQRHRTVVPAVLAEGFSCVSGCLQ